MLAPAIKELVARLDSVERDAQSGSSIVEVNKAISVAAAMYEKIRYLVDYREEHTLRRSAIERILRRIIVIEGREGISHDLLQELVEGEYVDAKDATEELAYAIDRSLQRYYALLVGQGDERIRSFLMSLAASDVESCLAPRFHAYHTITAEALYKTLQGNIVAPAPAEDIDVQLLCASYRALYRSDDAMIRFVLWHVYVPGWKEGNAPPADIHARLPTLFSAIIAHTQSDLQWQIVRKIRNEAIYFRIVRQLLEEQGTHAADMLAHSEELERYVRGFLGKVYEHENQKTQSSGIRAVAYLLLTKIAVGLVIELPYDIVFLGGVHYVPLFINMLFHPLFLFALTRRVGNLGEENTHAIIEGMKKVFYGDSVRTVSLASRYSSLLPLFVLAYLLLIFGVFSIIIGALNALDFSIVSTGLFLFFLALVSYFAFRIRYNANRWRVSGGETTLSLFTHVLAIPVIRLGEWLSRVFSSINIFVMLLDFLIETPFKLVLRFFREFIFFLRDRVEEVR